jgi:hypothetical protein
MYHHFDVILYAGDLGYKIVLDDPFQEIDLARDHGDSQTLYADHFLPVTQATFEHLKVTILSVAPVAPDPSSAPLAPAPLPGPPGMIYILHVLNNGTKPIRGKVILQAGDKLIGHYEDTRAELEHLKKPAIDIRQHTLLLTRPEGQVGLHLHNGRWTKLEAPFQAERAFELDPGADTFFETHIVLGQSRSQVMEAVFAMHLHSALDWINFTAEFWHSRLGTLHIGADGTGEHARIAYELFIRNFYDNFNCLQTDAQGNLISHWQGAPSHGYGTIWGIDVEPTAISIVQACPELARQVFLFFMNRSQAPKGPPDHSLPILVAPMIIARQWLQVTGDTHFFKHNSQVITAFEKIMQQVLSLEANSAALFPSRYSSDGVVGRRFDYGTNVKVWYAFDSMSYLLHHIGREADAKRYAEKANQIQADIQRTMLVDGPLGVQISGGTNLTEDPGTFYLPEDVLYYDGEDTSSMLAPIYGICDFNHPAWINYHRFARSLWHAGYDPEFDTLYWHPAEPAVFDGTAYFSRLAGGVTSSEMRAGLDTLREIAIDDVTGSVFWWPHGMEYKRSLTRCSQGQGAWNWQFFQQWLGIKIDALARTITFAPRGLLTHIKWQNFASGLNQFSIEWMETNTGTQATILNQNAEPWTVQVGFRLPGSGALGDLEWQSYVLKPGETYTFLKPKIYPQSSLNFPEVHLEDLEASAFGDAEGIVFKRFGPALLWGHWNPELQWRWDAMPLALRFILANFTGADWQDVRVQLLCPPNWLAQARLPRHWTPPDHLQKETTQLEIGPLANRKRAIAPFWIKAPFEFEVVNRWEDLKRPFHIPSQPGPGLEVFTRQLDSLCSVNFTAIFTAASPQGTIIERCLEIPVKIIPYS